VFPTGWIAIIVAACAATLPQNRSAQEQTGAERLAPATRAGQIEVEREAKAAALRPEEPTPTERKFDWVKNSKVIDFITDGVDGFRVALGGLPPGSGLTLGPEYYRPDLLNGQAIFRTSVRASWRKFYMMDAGLSLPKLAGDHAFFELSARHRNLPHIDYYGPGPDSHKSGRTSFLLEDTSLGTSLGLKPFRYLRFGATGSYLLVNVGHGRDDRFASTDQVFTEATTPGIQLQSNFLEGGGFVQFDWRNRPGKPQNGGNYVAEFVTYSDTKWGRYSFDRLNLDVQQYFGFLNDRRVIALRGRLDATDAHQGNRTPFYLQPTLGGADDLRGFRPFRFYGNAAMVLTGEYRWEVFSGLDMALFMDAGRVFDDWHQVKFTDLEKDYGFGFRFNVRGSVFWRIDVGFSREGFQIWSRFSNIF
jgi:hypothetical protein